MYTRNEEGKYEPQYEDLTIVDMKGEVAALFFEYRKDLRKLYQSERWQALQERDYYKIENTDELPF